MSLDVDNPARSDVPASTDPASTNPASGEPVAAAIGPLSPLHVTAVLVSHDGAAFLPRTLDAITAQTRPVDELIAVDTGSRDSSPALAAQATDRVLALPATTSFGDAVRAALDVLAAGRLSPAPDPRPDGGRVPGPRRPGLRPPGERSRHWLWLLHDDCAPAADALGRLLLSVDTQPSVGIAGCKQVGWDDARRLIDVGFTTSPLGKRVTGVDIDDLDQGQLDDRCDVLAVGTAGMLVRRDVWDLLGGPDPALSHARDDIDLCRRAHLAGFRVVVVPAAAVAQAGAQSGDRTRTAGSWRRADRRDAIHLRMASTAWPLLPLVLAWTVLAGFARAAGRLALKQPAPAADELAALGTSLLRPAAWLRARRRAGEARRVPRRALRSLLAGRRQVLRHRRDAVTTYLRLQEEAWAQLADRPGTEHPEAAIEAGPVQPIESGPVQPEAEAASVRGRGRRGGPGRFVPGLVLLAAAVAGVLGLRGLLPGTGTASSPALPALPAGLAELWRAATSSWRPVGLGGSAPADPLASVLAGLSLPFGGQPRTAVAVLLLAAVPLAALSAWAAASALTRSVSLRSWAALAWAAAPALLGSLGPGRLGAVIAHVMLPLAALGLARATGHAGPALVRLRGSLPAAAGAGLALSVVIAGAPALAVPAAIAVALAALAACSGRRLLPWTVLIPAVLLLPWWLAVARDPALLLAEAGGPTGPAATTDAVWHLALAPSDPAGLLGPGGLHGPAGWLLSRLSGWVPGPDGVLPRALAVLVAAPVLLLGLAGLFARGRRGLGAGALLLCGLAGLAVAAAAPVLVRSTGPERVLRAWPGAGVSLLTLGLIGAALVILDGAAGRLRRRSLGPPHALAVGLGVLTVLGPVGGLAAWSWQGAAEPSARVHRAEPDVLPGVAGAEAAGPAATRTLVLHAAGGTLSWWLARAAGQRFGDTSAALLHRRDVARSDRGQVAPLVAGLLSDTGEDLREPLASMAVGSVLLLPPADERTVAGLDAAAGLVRVANPRGSVLWRLDREPGPTDLEPAGVVAGTGATRPARARIVEPLVGTVTRGVLERSGGRVQALPSAGTDVDTAVPPGVPGRLLVLAERRDPGWTATLDGRALSVRTVDGWARAFRLPVEGGQLRVRHQQPWQGELDAARLGMLALALLAAVPVPRRRRRWGMPRRQAAPVAADPVRTPVPAGRW